VFVDNLTGPSPWIFYSLPIGVIALVLVAIQVPGTLCAGAPLIDYLGTAVLSLAVHLADPADQPWRPHLPVAVDAPSTIWRGRRAAGRRVLLAERRAAEPLLH